MKMKAVWITFVILIQHQAFCSVLKGDPKSTSDEEDVLPKDMVYLNVTIHQGTSNANDTNGTYSLKIDLIPVTDENFLKLIYRDLDENKVFQDPQAPLENVVPSTTTKSTRPTAVESFLQSTSAFSEGAVETIQNFFGSVPKFLGINVTQVRTDPLNTAVSSINNIAFCNPIFAGFNPGRCNGFLSAKP